MTFNIPLLGASIGTGLVAAPSSVVLGVWSATALYESTQYDERAADLYTGQALTGCEP